MALRSARPDKAAWLKGGEAHCNLAPNAPSRPRRLVLLGAPGVGKATQAALLAGRLGTCHLSTVEMFHDAQKLPECDRTPTMIIALEHLRNCAPVPDEIIQNLIVERSRCLRCKGGFVLEGFPRTAPQAEALDKVLTGQDVRLDAALHYELPVETILVRLSGRRTCPACLSVFNLAHRPLKSAGFCDLCGFRLTQGDDDRPQDILKQLQDYQLSAGPLNDFYQQKGILLSISAEGSPEEVFERTVAALQKRQGR